MSGHNKWAQIKHHKATTDAVKSRVFSRYARLIALESKRAGGMLVAPGLSAAIMRAKSVNMPKDNIERAVMKGLSKNSDVLEQIIYEMYGPGGAAIVVDVLTDNRNRTTQEIKYILGKHGVGLALLGTAVWAFVKQPDGTYVANEPREISGEDETGLSTILGALDEYSDVQRIFTNILGYEDIGG